MFGGKAIARSIRFCRLKSKDTFKNFQAIFGWNCKFVNQKLELIVREMFLQRPNAIAKKRFSYFPSESPGKSDNRWKLLI